jgi:Kef-type K+ transport system membrane component KefB
MPHLPTLLMQIAVIILAARVTGYLFRRIGQPQVVGEMAAGIILGPSLLGWIAPGIESALFPPDSLGALNALSQIGLIAFMFLVGLELHPKHMRGRGHTALITSHASITLPFLLGCLLALYLYPRLSDDSVTFVGFALFLGTAMSITAFPVLARILRERRLMHHPVGAIAIACAAVDDVTAWCILAAVVALVRASDSALPLWVTVAGSAVYLAAMIVLVKPWLRRFVVLYRARRAVSDDLMGVILMLVLTSAWITEVLGIHALFGAFLIGAVLPKHQQFVRDLRERLEGLVVVLLLPLFFAFTGLRTSIGQLGSADMWLYCGLVIVVAVAGKLGGSAIAARLTGMTWRQAGAIGILMNTRGLIQLVVLNIGLDIGVISPAMFTMMVLMALVTTFMTTPLLALVYPVEVMEREARAAEAGDGKKVLGVGVDLRSHTASP